jgi:uncharacterized membrane protein
MYATLNEKTTYPCGHPHDWSIYRYMTFLPLRLQAQISILKEPCPICEPDASYEANHRPIYTMLLNLFLMLVFMLISALLIAVVLVVTVWLFRSLGRGAREEELLRLNARREEALAKQQRALRLLASVLGI